MFDELTVAVKDAYTNDNKKNYRVYGILYPSASNICIISLISDEFNGKYYHNLFSCQICNGLNGSLEVCNIRMYPITTQFITQFSHDREVSFLGRFLDDELLFFLFR